MLKKRLDSVPEVRGKKIKINRKNLIFIVAILCVLGPASMVSAFRCGTQVVSIGDMRSEVSQMCGEPTSVDIWEEERIQRDFGSGTIRYYRDHSTGQYGSYREPLYVKVQVKIERWTYNLGSTQFIRYLIFENGVLKEITMGGKGN